jgi:hypothetical protein
MSANLTSLGVKRKDMGNDGPCCCAPDSDKKKEWEEEVVFPTIDAYGEIAKILPVDQMEPGIEYTATVKLQLAAIDGYGKKDGPTRVSIEVHAISDLESPEPAKEELNESSPNETAVLSVMSKPKS